MVQSQYSLSWDDYKTNVCAGFSSLQQNGELVDMTIAADGHFVKVHQVLMALVSPYIKDIITSAPGQHPVIFLNNVSYKTLCAILEYVYTGEVLVPAENLSSFMETAKNLHIRGLDGLAADQGMMFKIESSHSQIEENTLAHVSGTKRLTLPSESGNEEFDLPAAARKISVKRTRTRQDKSKSTNDDDDDAMPDYVMLEDMPNDDDDDSIPLDTKQGTSLKDPSNLQYSVSIRGSLQVILNRYIYNLQSPQQRSGTRRWRCIEYRNHRCLAFLVTKGNVVLNRANLHNHSFHDKKILQKIEKKAIFSALDDVEAYKEKELAKEAEAAGNPKELVKDEHYVSLNFDDEIS